MIMPSFKYVILYVKDINISKSFYTELLGQSPKELSPTFISYELNSGMAWNFGNSIKFTLPRPLQALALRYALFCRTKTL